jgi:DNA-binding NarL/FixJ family response regulator
MNRADARMSLRVLLADDSPEVRRSVRSLLEQSGFEIVGEAADGQEAVQLAQALDPDVAVLDVSMPRLNGLKAATQIRDACRRTKVILLTVHAEAHQILRAASTGIRGYVVKTEAGDDLVRAIGEVSRGGIFFSPKACGVVIESYGPGATSLSPFAAPKTRATA